MRDNDNVLVSKILKYCTHIEGIHSIFENNKNLFFDEDTGYAYRYAVTMPILQIGELAKNLSQNFRNTHNKISWRGIAGMRDIFAHHYGSINYNEVWKTSHEDILELKNYLLKILTETSQEL